MLSLSLARKLAAESIQKAQVKYKRNYDRGVKIVDAPLMNVSGCWSIILRMRLVAIASCPGHGMAHTGLPLYKTRMFVW